MVQLNQLYDDTKVEFVAGRKFLWNGTQYDIGDEIARADVKAARNRESLIRSGRIVVVTDDLNDVPRAYRREIRTRTYAHRRLKRVDNKPVNPTGKGIEEVQKLLSNPAHKAVKVWAWALLKETTHASPRSTLVDWLKAGDTPEINPANLESFVENASNYDEGEYLDDFEVADGTGLFA